MILQAKSCKCMILDILQVWGGWGGDPGLVADLRVGPAASGVAAAGEAVVDGWGDDERQNYRDKQSADDGDGQRLQHL